jgi:hypothetical protein
MTFVAIQRNVSSRGLLLIPVSLWNIALAGQFPSLFLPVECRAYHDEHMKQMEARAKEKRKTLNMPTMKPCEMMRDKGMVK